MTTSLCIPFTNPKTTVTKLADIPTPTPGATCPLVVSTEHTLLLGFFSGWEEWIALKFELCIDFSFGMPGEDCFESHPISKYGAERFACYEVHHSPWIDELDKSENQCNSSSSSMTESNFKHFIISMHDSMFECVAESYVVHKYSGFSKQRIGFKHLMEHFEFHG